MFLILANVKYFYINVANFTIQTINRYGVSKHGDGFLWQLFGLYQQGVKQGYLLNYVVNQQQISPFTYKNIVAIGLRLGEYDYVRGFLEDYRAALPKADRRTYYHYNLARYHYTVKAYTDAMPILNKLEGNQVFLLLDAKLMLLKIYYELKEYDVLEAHLRAFGQFLHRKRNVLSYHQANYKNIIGITKSLMELEPHNAAELAILR